MGASDAGHALPGCSAAVIARRQAGSASEYWTFSPPAVSSISGVELLVAPVL